MGRLLGHLIARNRTRQSRPCRHATCPTLLARASRRACFPPALLACGISPLGLSLPGTAEAGLWPAAISRALAQLRFLPLLALVAMLAAQPRLSVGLDALPSAAVLLCPRITISVRPALQRRLQQLDSFRHQSARPGAAHQPGPRSLFETLRAQLITSTYSICSDTIEYVGRAALRAVWTAGAQKTRERAGIRGKGGTLVCTRAQRWTVRGRLCLWVNTDLHLGSHCT